MWNLIVFDLKIPPIPKACAKVIRGPVFCILVILMFYIMIVIVLKIIDQSIFIFYRIK